MLLGDTTRGTECILLLPYFSTGSFRNDTFRRSRGVPRQIHGSRRFADTTTARLVVLARRFQGTHVHAINYEKFNERKRSPPLMEKDLWQERRSHARSAAAAGERLAATRLYNRTHYPHIADKYIRNNPLSHIIPYSRYTIPFPYRSLRDLAKGGDLSGGWRLTFHICIINIFILRAWRGLMRDSAEMTDASRIIIRVTLAPWTLIARLSVKWSHTVVLGVTKRHDGRSYYRNIDDVP